MNDLDIPNHIKYQYEKVLETFCKLHEISLSELGLFKPNKKPKKFIVDLLEQHFPVDHYGEAIDGIFHETSSLRSLLNDAIDYGYELGKNPKKIKDHDKKVSLYLNALNSLRMNFPEYKDEFVITEINNIWKVNEHHVSFKYHDRILVVGFLNYAKELNRLKIASLMIKENTKDFNLI